MTKSLIAALALSSALAGCSSDLGPGTEPAGNCVILPNLTIRSNADLAKIPTSCFGVEGTLEMSGTSEADLTALSDLIATAHLRIENNDGLRSFAGLENVNVLGDLIVAGNPDLTSIEGLEGTKSAGRVELTDNPALRTVVGLSNLLEVRGDLLVEGNTVLPDLRGLSRMEAVGGTFTIRDNAALPNLTGLDRFKAARGMAVSANPAMTTLTGARDLLVVAALEISDNPRLTSSSMDLTDVGDLNIARNAALTKIGFPRLKRAQGSVTIEGNPSMIDIDGFSGLFLAIDKVLTVRNNANLGQATGLQVIKAIGQGLIVTGNTKLSQCRATAIRTRIPSVAGGVEIRNNSTSYNPC